jgi:hypothetical protein
MELFVHLPRLKLIKEEGDENEKTITQNNPSGNVDIDYRSYSLPILAGG